MEYLIAILVMTHITILSVTIFLHRSQAHRGVELHPVVSHFMRFWLWLTTGMVTKQWVAVHRKHHRFDDNPGDPHSPHQYGIWTVLFKGALLYHEASKDKDMVNTYGSGTPADWVESNIYSAHSRLGIGLLLLLNCWIWGWVGALIWGIQMIWIPFFAAGVINGVGHAVGYRNFNVNDASTNISPWGILIGGEELHNNHHAYASSAKLSSKWFEFDIGWFYIRVMELLGLAKVKRLAGKIELSGAGAVDDRTLQAVITHRWDVLAQFSKSLKSTCVAEIKRVAETHRFKRPNITKWLTFDKKFLSDGEIARIQQFTGESKTLATIVSMRDELTELWLKSSATKEQLIHQLEDWCVRAEQSGITPLQEFSSRLRRYA